jgi:hypothetical protein
MNDTEALALLIYCNELDGRHSPNELKVKAWQDVFADSASAMTVAFAKDIARKHYALLDAMITPSTFVKAWRENRQMRAITTMNLDEDQADRHCRFSNCQCTHTGPCFRGWIDSEGSSTSPCRVCRPSLASILDEIPPLGKRQDQDEARIRNRFREANNDYV